MFTIFSLPLIFNYFTSMYIGIFFFISVPLVVCNGSWICELSFASYGKLLVNILSNTSFHHSFSHFFLALKIHTDVPYFIFFVSLIFPCAPFFFQFSLYFLSFYPSIHRLGFFFPLSIYLLVQSTLFCCA